MNATYFAQSPETLRTFRKQSLADLIDDLKRIWLRITQPYTLTAYRVVWA